MIVRVVPVLAGFEQRAELDGLIGLVVVHRPPVESGQALTTASASAARIRLPNAALLI
jgi:hypothetical protein